MGVARFSLAVVLALPPTIFIGTVGGQDRDLLLWERTPGTILGAAVVEKGVPALVTGTIRHNHVVAGPIDATIVWKTFDGRPYPWDLKGTWSGTRIDFWNDSSTTHQSVLNFPRDATMTRFDALHDDLRARRWPAALVDAQIICAITQDCGWTDAVRALMADKKPPGREFAPWRILEHERAGRNDLAEAAAKHDCEGYSRIGCRFYVDHAKSADAYHLACRMAGVACDRYWGADAMALIDASTHGDVAAVRRLLEKPVNVNAGGEELLPSPAQAAAMSGSLPVMKLLLERGACADVPYPKSGYLSPLFYAIDGRHEELAIFLLEQGASIHRPGRDESLLVEAVLKNEARVVHKMLVMGEKPDDRTVPAGSALTEAVDERNFAIVRDLLAFGADPDLVLNHSRGSPIDHARRTHQTKMLRLLLAAKKERPPSRD